MRFTMLALVLVTVALVSALTAMRLAIHGQEVAVPNLVGLTPIEAERTLAGLGLQVAIERQYYSAQIPEGKIMSQLPAAGTKVRRGWELRVAESLGPMRISIPAVIGQSERAAELNIKRRGLELASTAEVEMPAIPSGQVLAQDPTARETQVSAPKISLLLTAPANPQAYVMPNFVGQPLGSVSRTLQDAGFKLGNVSMAPVANATNPNAPAGAGQESAGTPAVSPSTPPQAQTAQPSPASIIVSQNPRPGEKVTAGAVVEFQVK